MRRRIEDQVKREGLMCQPGWSYNPYQKKRSNPSFQSGSLWEKLGLIRKTKQAGIPHLAETLWWQKKKPETDQQDLLLSSRAKNPNRCHSKWWTWTTESFSAVLHLFIQPRSHPTRSAGSPLAHAHFQTHTRCRKALLSAGCFTNTPLPASFQN